MGIKMLIFDDDKTHAIKGVAASSKSTRRIVAATSKNYVFHCATLGVIAARPSARTRRFEAPPSRGGSATRSRSPVLPGEPRECFALCAQCACFYAHVRLAHRLGEETFSKASRLDTRPVLPGTGPSLAQNTPCVLIRACRTGYYVHTITHRHCLTMP